MLQSPLDCLGPRLRAAAAVRHYDRQVMELLKKWKHIIYSGFCGMVVVGIAWFVSSDDSSRQFKISFRGAALEMQAENMEVDHEALLDSMYTHEFSRGGLMAWLENKQIFASADPSLVESIANHVCGRIPEDDREERLRRGKECANEPVVAELRRLADSRDPPFHYAADVVKFGVPDDRPKPGTAYVCRNGIFWRKTVRLSNLDDSSRFVRVEVAGHYPCVDPSAPQIQISEEDAVLLIGGPIRRTEEVLAIVVD